MADETLLTIALLPVTEQFKVLKQGNVEGRVYRLLAQEPIPVYDSPTTGAHVMRRVQPGILVVGYDDHGEMQQVLTVDELFGYIKRSVILLPVPGLTPQSLSDPEKRAAVEATLPPLAEMGSAHAEQLNRTKRDQYYFMAGFVGVLLLGFLSVLLMHPASKKAAPSSGPQAQHAQSK